MPFTITYLQHYIMFKFMLCFAIDLVRYELKVHYLQLKNSNLDAAWLIYNKTAFHCFNLRICL